MAYQEVTKKSYGSRLGGSLKGIVTGLALFIASTALLWWNEGRAVKTSKMLKSAESVCVDVADVSTVDPALNGRMIHATAVAKTDEVLTDPDYGVRANAIRLVREAEYYQWVEHSQSETKDKLGGGQETVTTYTYSLEWVGSPVNSANFHDPAYQSSNSVRRVVADNEVRAAKVDFGGYVLPPAMAGAIPANTPANLPETISNGTDTFVSGNVVYYGENPQQPAVGDVRVTFLQAEGGEASILAQVTGNTFEPFTHKNGKSLMSLSMGNHSMASMFETEKSTNRMILWIFRILGIILVIAALRMTFSILVTILKVLPPLAKVGEVGVNLVTFIVGLVWSLVVILIAWVFWRPLLAVALAVVIAALIFFLVSRSKKAAAGEEAVEAAN